MNKKDRPDIIDYDTGVGANVKLDFSFAVKTSSQEHPRKRDLWPQKGKARRYKSTPIKCTPVYTVLHSSLWYSNTLAVGV